MRNSLRLSLATLVLAASSSVFAHTTVSNAWARATVAQQQATGIFLDLKSGHDKAQLVSVSTDIAASAELHEMRAVQRWAQVEGDHGVTSGRAR